MSDTNNPSEPEPAAPTPVAAEAPAPAAPAAPPVAPPARGGGGVIGLIVLLLVLLLGGGAAGAWFFWLPHHPMPALAKLNLPFLPHPTPAPGTLSVAPAAPPAPVAVQATPAAPLSSETPSAAPPSGAPLSGAPLSSQLANIPGAPAAPMQEEAAGLLTDAQHAGLPRDQLSALAVENGKLGAATPDQANALAMAMARNEAAMLGRNAAVRQREVETTLGSWGGGGGAVASVRRARANLAAAISAVNQAPDGVSAIEAARRAVAAYPAFLSAYTAATRFYLPAKRAQFWAVAGQCRSLYNEVYAYAANARAGGVFATEGRREAFQEMQDNVTRAQGYIGELNQLAYDERYDGDPGRLNGNLNRAQGIKAALYNLYAVSGNLYEANK
jgi:hypothetical protein